MSHPKRVISNWGTYEVTLSATPLPIKLNVPFNIQFSVVPRGSAEQLQATDLQVIIDAQMPTHSHGMNRQPELTVLADGSYLAHGMLFHMPGHWELYFDITQSGRTDRAEIDVELK
jgi:hypothetical protein